MLHSQYCRDCRLPPDSFHDRPEVEGVGPERTKEEMFQCAMSDDFDNSEDKIIRLRQYNWFVKPIDLHPFHQPDVPVTFDPYQLPRCIEHDFSEGIIEFLVTEIFKSSMGRNLTERSHNCQIVADNILWFPGVSGQSICKLASVRLIRRSFSFFYVFILFISP